MSSSDRAARPPCLVDQSTISSRGQ
jgi:hypothetical protein